ncbi:uncharacterized protein LOC135366592 [Ornithodoros turicata]|uniref:uncharacterized protein LOC135366592 n=1 Tax=Ornithodoros turicata TaxID=34597 RepID=UPI003138E07C
MHWAPFSFFLCLLFVDTRCQSVAWEGEPALPNQPPSDLPRLSGVEVACGKRHMRVQLHFSGPFNGIVFSKGHHGQQDCVYVRPGSGATTLSFDVFYEKCGTKPDHHGNFYENTIVVQYGVDIIEAWDEAKRLRCEWHDAYEKSALKTPSIQLADLEVQELNFQGDSVGCWFEIQEGKGPWAKQVSSIVPLGSPLTMVIAINDRDKQFDMRVKSCSAHDGARGPPIQLTDEHGCVLRPKMLTAFMKVRDFSGRASVVAFSHFYAFKFPDSIEVQIQCIVEICRHGCPVECQNAQQQQQQQLHAASSQKVEKHHQHHHQVKDRPPSNDVEGIDSEGHPPIKRLPGPPIFVPPVPHPHHHQAGGQGQSLHAPRPPVFVPPVFKVPPPHAPPSHPIPFGARLPPTHARQPLYTGPVHPQPPGPLTHNGDDREEAPAVHDTTTFPTRFMPETRRPTPPPPLDEIQPVYVPSTQNIEETTEDVVTQYDYYETDAEAETIPPSTTQESATATHQGFHVPHSSTVEVNGEATEQGAAGSVQKSATHPTPADERYEVPVPEPGPSTQFNAIRPGPPMALDGYKPGKPHYPYPIPTFQATNPAVIQDRMDTIDPTEPTVTKVPIIVKEVKISGRFPSGPRSLRSKREAQGPSDQLGVRGIIKVVSGVDLAFLPNATRDGTPLYMGHYEQVIYGVCLPATGLAASVGAFVLLILCTTCIAAYLFYVLRTYQEKNRQSFMLGRFLTTHKGVRH